MTDEVEIKFHIKSFSLLYLFTVLCIMEHDLATWGHIQCTPWIGGKPALVMALTPIRNWQLVG